MCNEDYHKLRKKARFAYCDICFKRLSSMKAPMGRLKKENYEISRESVNRMIAEGDLTENDVKQWS